MDKTVEITPKRRHFFRTLEAKSLRSRSQGAKIADRMTSWSSSPTFLFLNLTLFVVWIALNTNIVPGFQAFDPFPYGLLTMAVSLEAIILSIFVLISQNRAAQIATLREELHLRINLIAEREITKILQLMVKMNKHTGVKADDPELDQMLQEIDTWQLEHSITEQLERANKPTFSLLSKKEFADFFKSFLSGK